MTNDQTGPQDRNSRADRLERQFAVPVVVAALVSVPAVFLTSIGDGFWAVLGTVLNWASVAVLTTESVALFILAGDRLAWVRRYAWPLVITALAIPAVILSLAPVQVLRLLLTLLRHIAALRILRAKRLVSAGRVIGRRISTVGRWRHFPVAAGSAAAVVFVALILADPVSVQAHHRALSEIIDWVGMGPAFAAAGVAGVGAAALFAWRRRRD